MFSWCITNPDLSSIGNIEELFIDIIVAVNSKEATIWITYDHDHVATLSQHIISNSKLNDSGTTLLFTELGKNLHDFLKDDRNMQNMSGYKYLTYDWVHRFEMKSTEKSEELLLREDLKQVGVRGKVLNSSCQI